MRAIEEEIAKKPCGCFVFSCAGDVQIAENHDLTLFQDPEDAERLYEDALRQGLPASWGVYAITKTSYYLHPFENEEFYIVAMQMLINNGFLSIEQHRKDIEEEITELFFAYADMNDDDGWVC